MSAKRALKWLLGEGPIGHSPSRPIDCPICAGRLEIRYAALTELPEVGPAARANNLYFKCPQCANLQAFGVVVEVPYFEELKKRRGGKLDYTPTAEWREVEAVRRQLEALGYWGGGDREDLEEIEGLQDD